MFDQPPTFRSFSYLKHHHSPSPLLARYTSRKYFLASTNPFHQLKRTVSHFFAVDLHGPTRTYPGECFPSRCRWLTPSVLSKTWGGQQEHKSCAYLYVVPGISIPLQLQSREAGSGGEETEGTNVKGSPPGGDEARSLKWLPKDQDTRLGDFSLPRFVG